MELQILANLDLEAYEEEKKNSNSAFNILTTQWEKQANASQNAVWENAICATKHIHLKTREVYIIHFVGGDFRQTVVPE